MPRFAPIAVLALSVLASCGPAERSIVVALRAEVGGEPFACGGTYEGVGTTGTTLTASDFRFYVHDVRVVTATGEVPVALTDDGIWQSGGIALIDFESGGSGCSSGTAPTNATLRGTIPDDTGAITGLRFTVGVPEERNHLDSALQPSPLNLSTLFWSWNDGYKFVRIEAASTGQPLGFSFHLAATGCTGDARMGTRVCTNGNRPEISLEVPSGALERGAVVADLGDLFSTSDLDTDGGRLPGCLSDADDPDCAVMMPAIGIGGSQTLFHFEAAP